MPSSGEAIALLQSMNALLKGIDASQKAILAELRKGARKQTASAAPTVASDADLDGPHGDPVVRMKDPRDWSGASMKGRRFSECPAEYLDLVASRFDYFAEQAEATNEMYEGKPVAPRKRKDAARARGWAARVRAGKVQHQPVPTAAPANWAADAFGDDGQMAGWD